jgi:hypothetical protein
MKGKMMYLGILLLTSVLQPIRLGPRADACRAVVPAVRSGGRP